MRRKILLVSLFLGLLFTFSNATGVADMTAQLQDMVNVGGLIELSSGTHYVSSTIDIPSNTTIRGKGQGSTTIKYIGLGNEPVFSAEGVANAKIEDLKIDGSDASGVVGVETISTHNFILEDIKITRCGTGVIFGGGVNQFISKIHDFVIDWCDDGIVIGGNDNIRAQDTFISSGIVANCTGSGILMKHASGVFGNMVDVINCHTGVDVDPDIDQRVSAVILTAVLGDTCSTHGIYVHGGGDVYEISLNNCWGATNAINGLCVDGNNIEVVSVTGGRYLNNGWEGIHLQGGAKNISVVGAQAFNNSQYLYGAKHGIKTTGVEGVILSNNICGNRGSMDSQGYGVVIAPGTTNSIVKDNIFRDNTVKGLLDQANHATNIVKDNISY